MPGAWRRRAHVLHLRLCFTGRAFLLHRRFGRRSLLLRLFFGLALPRTSLARALPARPVLRPRTPHTSPAPALPVRPAASPVPRPRTPRISPARALPARPCLRAACSSASHSAHFSCTGGSGSASLVCTVSVHVGSSYCSSCSPTFAPPHHRGSCCRSASRRSRVAQRQRRPGRVERAQGPRAASAPPASRARQSRPRPRTHSVRVGEPLRRACASTPGRDAASCHAATSASHQPTCSSPSTPSGMNPTMASR